MNRLWVNDNNDNNNDNNNKCDFYCSSAYAIIQIINIYIHIRI